MKALALILLVVSLNANARPNAPEPGKASSVKDARTVLKRNLDIMSAIPQDLGSVQGYDGDTSEFNPYAPGAEQELEAFDEAYQRETGDSGRIDNGSGMRADSPFADLFDRIGGCYQESCPVFAHVSRAKQTLTLYLNGRAVDVWPVSTGVEGFETPRMDQHVSSRIYTRYSSSKYPGGDFNGLGNMPYAVFIRGGFAIHGTPRGNWRLLGRRASHGCIRLHPSHGATFNRLVRENGNTNVWILVD